MAQSVRIGGKTACPISFVSWNEGINHPVKRKRTLTSVTGAYSLWVQECDYHPIVISDHAPHRVKLNLPAMKPVYRPWRLNPLLLSDEKFLDFIFSQINFFLKLIKQPVCPSQQYGKHLKLLKRVVSSTGAPQGTVLAPFLLTLYTADFMYSSPNCHLQKFSDDSAIVGLITNEEDSEYRELILDCVDWCLQNHLQINAGKTKELVVDFRRCRHPPPLVNIRGMDIERVDSYKYLGVHLNNKLGWSVNTTALHTKGQSRLYLLRRLRSCGVQGALIRTSFHTVVASAIFYGVVCWGSSISTADRKRLDQLLKRAGSVLGSPLDPVQVVGDRRMLAKLASTLENDSHPMPETLAAPGCFTPSVWRSGIE
ncbi:hypothetical protein NFI96_027037, partial [Prochilodus magdalenae]